MYCVYQKKMQSISLQGRPTLHNVNAKSSEGTGPEKWRIYYFTAQTANTELLAAGQEIIPKLSPRSWCLPHRSSTFPCSWTQKIATAPMLGQWDKEQKA